MLDINLVRGQPDLVRAGMEKRGMDAAPVDQIIDLDSKRRKMLVEVESLKAERNKISKEVGRTKDETERETKIAASRGFGENIKDLDEKLRKVDYELRALMAIIPNITYEEVPAGGEDDNIIVREVGDIPAFDFEAIPHWDLGPELGIIDFERGVKMSG